MSICTVSRRVRRKFHIRFYYIRINKRNRIIQEMWFASYTQEEIAERIDIPQQTISDKIKDLPKIENFPKSVNFANYQDDTAPLYDV